MTSFTGTKPSPDHKLSCQRDHHFDCIINWTE